MPPAPNPTSPASPAKAAICGMSTDRHPLFRLEGTRTMSKRSTWISGWNPEDKKFWESEGKFIARRNLIFSILAEHLGFSIWLIWSVVVTKLPLAGFHFTTEQLFQ